MCSRLSGTNLNLQIKALMRKAGWNYSQPKIRHRQGWPVVIKTKSGQSFRFSDHINGPYNEKNCYHYAVTNWSG